MKEQYLENVRRLDAMLHPDDSFDMIRRRMMVAQTHEATLYYIDGFVKDEVSEKLMEYYVKAPDLNAIRTNLPYTEVDHSTDFDQMVTMVLSGATLMAVDGLEEVLIIDTREYPTRGITEPENDKVLRGPRDGFSETLIFNTALIRRRIRDTRLVMSIYSVGERTRTDVVVTYLKDRADPVFVKKLTEKIQAIRIKALNLGQESMAELLIRQRWYNPFPKIRYTERPDVVSASLMEGSVAVLCDNQPAVMILPTSIFDFVQESDDYYFPPFVGSYLRMVRLLIFAATLFLTPVWYLLTQMPEILPEGLSFIGLSNEPQFPVFWQLILVELVVDGLKMASLNTPSSLSNSLSIVGGLILGDFAVQVGWLIPEVIVYMAFVSIANFTQASYELGYALKFMRILLLVCSAVGGWWGFAIGSVLIVVLVALNKTVDGSRSYLYPLIPFNGRALLRLLFRVKLREGRKH